MWLFDFFKRRIGGKSVDEKMSPVDIEIDRSRLSGRDFEFLITGDINIKSENFDDIMTPNSFAWIKIERDNWVYYQIGDDDFYYSIEPPGIQMVFNKEISFTKAKVVVDEIIYNLKANGQEAELVIIDTNKIYKF